SATSGSIAIAGKALADWPLLELAQQRSFLAQSRSDPFGYSALESVLSARHPWAGQQYWERASDRAIALAALAQMEVQDLAARDVRSLSGGERQRIAIAALLAQDTPLMLLDEPANALDLAHQVSVMRLLAEMCANQQKAAIMVVHDLNLAQRVASHVLLLYGDGRWLAGTKANMLQADLLSACLGHPLQVVQHGTQQIFLPLDE
ncbi:MAG: ABC transporter ATP-binding protein, partial [Burkholderiales bacterium]|nr:ABC transporter ATP-binding protein [Burkholderiales bacterium]